eukprot:7378752-Prymnesium_polylepis.1
MCRPRKRRGSCRADTASACELLSGLAVGRDGRRARDEDGHGVARATKERPRRVRASERATGVRTIEGFGVGAAAVPVLWLYRSLGVR